MTSPFARKTGQGRQPLTASRRPWRLVELNRSGAELRTSSHASLVALARATRKAKQRVFDSPWYRPMTSQDVAGLLPLSPNGKPLDLVELLAFAERLVYEGYHYFGYSYEGYVRRRGPVRGIRCMRGGWGRYRRPATVAERRANALVLQDEGEVGCRGARRDPHLPDSWDEFLRHRERCWKSQHKGRKAWDRS